jgi:MFS family permease
MKLDKYDIFYIGGLLISTGVMITLFLLLFIFKFTLLNYTLLLFFWVLRFLSGFGLILTVTNIFLFLLNLVKDKIGKTAVNAFIIIQVIIPVILIIFGIYKIVSSLGPAQGASLSDFSFWSDFLLFAFGICSISLSLYIIPLLKEEFQSAADEGIFTRLKRGAKKVGRGAKKKYFSFRKKYAKAEIQDQTTIKEILEIWRSKFAVYLLLPLGIGSLIFTPITFVCLVFWIRFFVFDEDPEPYERFCLLISIIFVATIGLLSYLFDWVFYSAISELFWSIELFYLAGIIISSVIFIYQVIQLKGVTLEDVKETVGTIGEREESED